MTVYVGEKFGTVKCSIWPYKYAAHLFADSVPELHRFASSIGLKRQWFQNHHRLPHYDVTAAKRGLAIQKGAIEVDRKTEVTFYRERR